MSARQPSPGAQLGRRALSNGIYAPSNSILVPREPPLERSQLKQACLDIIALIFIALFLSATALAIPVAIFLMLFAV